MDLDYFRRVAPVTDEIISIIIAAGWALLLGNLVFQATKSMMTGLGFEGEDPKLLFMRTFVFSFLLLASRQVCDIGLGISASVIQLLQIPNSVTISLPDENNFNIGASWLLVIIVNFIIMWQLVKLFFEIAERYVVTAVLVILSPLAFATGGSKNTADIFKGWCRMFGSMCLMMVLNVVFLKLLIAAMGHMPSDVGVLPWMLLIVGIARVARKADGIVARMGLNPAMTGDGLGRGLPGMMAYAVVKSVGSTVAKTVSHSAGRGGSTGPRRSNGPAHGGRSTPPPSPPPTPPSGGSSGTSRPAGNSAGGTTGTAGNSQGGIAPGNGAARPAAAYAQQNSTGTSSSVTNTTVSNQQTQTVSGQGPAQQPVPGSGAKAQRPASQGPRRTSVPPGTKTAWQNTPRPSASQSPSAPTAGTAKAAGGAAVQSRQETPERPPIPRAGQNSVKSGAPFPSGGNQAPRGASRRTSAVHISSTTASRTAATHSSTQTSSQQQGAASKPIRQNGTRIISPPPGVGSSGKGERSYVNVAGTHKTSVPTQPPIGGRQAPSGMAGTGRAWLSVWYSLQKRGLTEEDRSYIDSSLIECYGRFGITFDNASLFEEDGKTLKEMPVVKDWYDLLMERSETRHLAVVLTRYVSGSAASMGGRTNVDTDNPYTVIDLTGLSDDLQLAAVYAATGFATDVIVQSGDVGTALLSDELWKLLGANSNPLAADYTMQMVKLIRSQGGIAGVTSQGMADMMALDGGKYGKGILDSCRVKFIMQMEEQEARLVQEKLALTEEETRMITRFRRGEGLLCIGHNHVPIAIHVSPKEYEAITTSPTDLRARLRQEG